MELYCTTRTDNAGNVTRHWTVSRFASSQKHNSLEALPGTNTITTEPVNVPTSSYAAMAAFLNQMEASARTGESVDDSPPHGALAHQEGGSHYKDLAIQPVEYIHANGLSYFEGNVIKYVTRWKKKNGVADLKKARHYIDLLMELETQKE